MLAVDMGQIGESNQRRPWEGYMETGDQHAVYLTAIAWTCDIWRLSQHISQTNAIVKGETPLESKQGTMCQG